MSLSEQFLNMNINPGRRPPLSANDPSDPRTTSARKLSERNAKNEQARFLVKAFEEFILPIVHAQGSGSGTANRKKNANGECSETPRDNTDRTRLGPAAQQLIDALENFISSLVSPEVIRNDRAQREEVSDIRENTGLIPYVKPGPQVYGTQPKSLILAGKSPERSQLLKLALEKARHQVFNKMPIRLLTFRPDGSGMKLFERSDTWEYVSTSIEAGFNENQMNEDVKRRNYPVYNPGAEKEAIEHYISPYTRYAILSHTWLHEKPGEVTYGDWNTGNIDTGSPGYQKLSTFCKVAAKEYGITLAWMDTVCINKDSSAELDESIRSMYNWYRDASICITYLAQTTVFADMDKDTWFTRGWTLQELFAPPYIKFYDANWTKFTSDLQNDKENSRIQSKISAATTITAVELNNLNSISFSRRMQWAANRQVTREEDTAYSLMGLFNVSISIAYGEGAERAFFRLVQQILNSYPEGIDIINWGYGPDLAHSSDITRVSSLIPSRPQQYLWRTTNIFRWPITSIPVTLTHLGLHLSVLVMPAILAGGPFHPIGSYYGTVTLETVSSDLDGAFPPPSQSYNILDRAAWSNTNNSTLHQHQITLGVLNFMTTDSWVSFLNPITCFAIALRFNNSSYSSLAEAVAVKSVEVIRTRTAIDFDLHSLYQPMHSPYPNWAGIPIKDLAQHGMQLFDMYL